MDWDNSSIPGYNVSDARPGQGGLSQSYPELEPVFKEMGIHSQEDKLIIVTYMKQMFMLGFKYLENNTQDDKL